MELYSVQKYKNEFITKLEPTRYRLRTKQMNYFEREHK